MTTLRNIKLVLEYDGSRYDGWQRLTNPNTIQGKLEEVLSKMTGETVEIIGSGRTDAGVHAQHQVANFKTACEMPVMDIRNYMNQYLPKDIAIKDVEEVDERFHSRYNGKSKEYMYRIWNDPIPTVFHRKYTHHIPKPLDINAMIKASEHLIGEHDFTSFATGKKTKKSMVRTIYSIKIWEEEQEIRILFHGDGFLYNMVRIMVGTLIEVGLHKLQSECIPEILAHKERKYAGETAPAQGVVLCQVHYE